jgi:membrane fusion protein (multidrug efflux system)
MMSTPEEPQEFHPANSTTDTNGSSKGRYRTLGLILAILVILGGIGLFWWLQNAHFESTDDAYITGHIHPVSARVGGTVIRVQVEDNQDVSANQPLVAIDPKDYMVALNQAIHNLAVTEAQAKTAQTNIPLAQRQAAAQIAQAQAGIGVASSTTLQTRKAAQEAHAGVQSARQAVNQQEANYQKALLDYRRYAGADPEAISAQQLDTARTNLRVAEANRAAARSQLAEAQAREAQAVAGISTSTSRISEARGTFQGAQAQTLQVNVAKSQAHSAMVAIAAAKDAVAQAKLNLGYTRIAAPVTGRVGNRNVEVGQQVQPGQPLLSIVSPEKWIVANFKETQLKRIHPGQPVTIEVDAYPNHHFTGHVDSFAPASGAQFALLPPENASGNFTKTVQRVPVKIIFDPDSIRGYESLLVPGLSVVPRVDVSNEKTMTTTRTTTTTTTTTTRGTH